MIKQEASSPQGPVLIQCVTGVRKRDFSFLWKEEPSGDFRFPSRETGCAHAGGIFFPYGGYVFLLDKECSY
jgi:hypothetical protein